jgi:hypothetical protein
MNEGRWQGPGGEGGEDGDLVDAHGSTLGVSEFFRGEGGGSIHSAGKESK